MKSHTHIHTRMTYGALKRRVACVSSTCAYTCALECVCVSVCVCVCVFASLTVACFSPDVFQRV